MAEPKTLVIGATLLALTGVEPQPIFWAVVGATIGLSFAPSTSRLRAVVAFVAVVLLSALGGTFLASVGFEIAPAFVSLARNTFSATLAVVFHPLTTALVNAVPTIVAKLIERIPRSKT
jgi:hypothetical protein